MARKTRTCQGMKLETLLGALRLRKCTLTRNHSGRCWDGAEAFDVDA